MLVVVHDDMLLNFCVHYKHSSKKQIRIQLVEEKKVASMLANQQHYHSCGW